MRFYRTLICIVLSFAGQTLCAGGEKLRSISAINAFLASDEKSGRYSVTAQVTSVRKDIFVAQDATGRAMFNQNSLLPPVEAGNLFLIEGPVSVSETAEPWIGVDRLDRICTARLHPPPTVRLCDLDADENDLMTVSVTGTVLDVGNDEIDTRYKILLLKDDDRILPVSFSRGNRFIGKELLDASIRLTGVYERTARGVRKFSGPFIDLDDDIPVEIIKAAPSNPFDVPPLEKRPYMTPREVSRLGRRSVSGRILATWGGQRLMVRDTGGRIVNVELASDTSLPNVGQVALFTGHPATDLFHLNLTQARYKTLPTASPPPDEIPQDIAAEALVAQNWHDKGKRLYHGALLRITGTVRKNLPDNQFLMSCGLQDVTIDVSVCPEIADGIAIGSEISVTGRCLLHLDNWSTDNIFPRIRGFSLVIRSPTDIRILSAPPWWTPARLLLVIAILVAALIVVYVRNRLLKRLAAVKLRERTQLAVELHDSLSQTLAGLACQISSAKCTPEAKPDVVRDKLAVAEKMLGSCRTELRNCLFDLRNDTMEEKTFDAAILRTLEPFAEHTRLKIRFQARRSRFDDASVHTVLAIIRELVANAIRHGRASVVRVAGTIDGNRLVFSVADDGIGFDPDRRPGSDDGHFGIDGICERVERADGTFSLTSSSRLGTKAVIHLPMKENE